MISSFHSYVQQRRVPNCVGAFVWAHLYGEDFRWALFYGRFCIGKIFGGRFSTGELCPMVTWTRVPSLKLETLWMPEWENLRA